MASSCVCACRRLDPSRSRPTIDRPRLPRLDALCTGSGVQMSMPAPRFSPEKRGGATPMMVSDRPSSTTCDPIADGEPPKARCHNPSAITATGGASGVESAAPRRRPIAGLTPSTSKNSGETVLVRTRYMAFPAAMFAAPSVKAASPSKAVASSLIDR